jgi:membrane protease YdiL (CAAX protease family)
MSVPGLVWRPPPGWPEPPAGWVPPAGWKAPPEWPAPPPDWEFWVPAAVPQTKGAPPAAPEPPQQQPPPPQPSSGPVAAQSRRGLVLETWFVQVAFLVPSVLAAVDLFAAHTGGAAITRFPTIVSNPAANLILGVVTYLQVAAVVPLALLLLSRTGQRPATLGLVSPTWRTDVWPGLGIAASGYGVAFLATIVLTALVGRHSRLFDQVPIGHVPHYYVIYGVAVSAITAIAEETLVSGYLLTRLEQLGWNPRTALLLSLTLRTSYHVYYGLGFLLTIPLGYYATRSFQKHQRLMRPIVAHFLYDAVLITISVLVS